MMASGRRICWLRLRVARRVRHTSQLCACRGEVESSAVRLHSAMLCTADFEAHARKVLTKETWDYYEGGANNEQTLKENVIAFSRYLRR